MRLRVESMQRPLVAGSNRLEERHPILLRRRSLGLGIQHITQGSWRLLCTFFCHVGHNHRSLSPSFCRLLRPCPVSPPRARALRFVHVSRRTRRLAPEIVQGSLPPPGWSWPQVLQKACESLMWTNRPACLPLGQMRLSDVWAAPPAGRVTLSCAWGAAEPLRVWAFRVSIVTAELVARQNGQKERACVRPAPGARPSLAAAGDRFPLVESHQTERCRCLQRVTSAVGGKAGWGELARSCLAPRPLDVRKICEAAHRE